jgi:glycerol-3-phosphate O-acyltransferase/dihydroxyacetone phosphate acyltransferase
MVDHEAAPGSWARNRLLRRVVDGLAFLTWREVAIDDLGATAEGPVLLVANHFGGFADALVLMSVLPRRPRILADDSIWKVRVVGWLMDWVGAIPVHRGHRGTTDNTDMFAAAHRALADGELVLIFPEGITREEPSIGEVRSGAARIAIGARGHGVSGLRIVPVGLHYEDKAAFRSVVYVREGRPIELDRDLEDERITDLDRAEVERLTEVIAGRLRDTAPDYDDWREARALQMAAEAFLRSMDPDEGVPVGLRDRLGAWLARRDDVDDLVAVADRYRLALSRLGATDAWASRGQALLSRRRIITVVTWLLMLPYAVLGVVAWSVPSVATWAVSRLRMAPAMMATVLPIAALVLFGLTSCGWLWWGWDRDGSSGLMSVVVLAPLTFAAMGLVIERGLLWLRWLRNRLTTLGGRGRRLGDLRDDVVEAVADRVVDALTGQGIDL